MLIFTKQDYITHMSICACVRAYVHCVSLTPCYI